MRQLSNAIVALSLASSIVTPASAAAVTVKDTRGLNAALKSASPGETILLAAGQYDGVSVRDVKASSVTIESADPSHPAILTGFYIVGSSGLTFSNLIFTTEGSGDPYPFRIGNSNNITLTNLSVHGSMDGNPQNDKSGVWVGNGSDHITIKNSEFQELLNGIAELASTNVVIDSNYIHNMGTDGIDNGGSSNVVISNNYLSDFFFSPGQHPDAIQFWTANTTAPATNITVTNNLIDRGKGTISQGVFMGNELNLKYSNVSITNNVLAGTLWNGIAIGLADHVTVSGNIIQAFGDQESWIVLHQVSNATLSGNKAERFNYDDSKPIQSGNTVNNAAKDKGAAAIAAWKSAHAGAVYGPARK